MMLISSISDVDWCCCNLQVTLKIAVDLRQGVGAGVRLAHRTPHNLLVDQSKLVKIVSRERS
jgi:hypothetical protein